MIWFYRLQQHVAITRFECTVLLVAALGFGGGFVAQTVQEQSRPLASEVYAEADLRFYTASQQPRSVPVAERQEAMPQPQPVIDLNRASAEELQRLPRVGPKTAACILDYRARRGGFRRVEDLTRVSGIGPKTLERLAPLVVVD